MWKFRKTDDDEDDEAHVIASFSLLEIYRNFAYDSGVKDPEQVLQALMPEDYTPVSEEGSEKMYQDSLERLQEIAGVRPLLEIQANFAAASYVELYARTQEIDDDDKAQLMETFLPFAYSILIASYAGLNEYLDALRG